VFIYINFFIFYVFNKILLQSNQEIDEDLIKNTFERLGALWVYYKWRKQGVSDFNKNLEILNKRIRFFRKNSSEQFIKKFFKIAYSRFFKIYSEVKQNINNFPDLL